MSYAPVFPPESVGDIEVTGVLLLHPGVKLDTLPPPYFAEQCVADPHQGGDRRRRQIDRRGQFPRSKITRFQWHPAGVEVAQSIAQLVRVREAGDLAEPDAQGIDLLAKED